MATDPIPDPTAPSTVDTTAPVSAKPSSVPPVVFPAVVPPPVKLPDKTIAVGVAQVATSASHLVGVTDDNGNLKPPTFLITATLNGKTLSHTLTIGAVNGGVVAPTLADLQAAVDNARMMAAQHLAVHDAVSALVPQLT